MNECVIRELARYHPLKGAIFARDWYDEAMETDDPEWRSECLREYAKAVIRLKEAYAEQPSDGEV